MAPQIMTIELRDSLAKALNTLVDTENAETPLQFIEKLIAEHVRKKMTDILKKSHRTVGDVAKSLGIEEEQLSNITALELVQEYNEEALLIDGFDDALIGIIEQFGRPPIALYDRQKCITVLMEHNGMSDEEAKEFFEFKIIGDHAGKNAPAYATLAV